MSIQGIDVGDLWTDNEGMTFRVVERRINSDRGVAIILVQDDGEPPESTQ